MYNAYKIESDTYYTGISLVGAENAEEANSFIKSFKEHDPENKLDSFGYIFVEESDLMEDIFAEHKGIIYHGICYRG